MEWEREKRRRAWKGEGQWNQRTAKPDPKDRVGGPGASALRCRRCGGERLASARLCLCLCLCLCLSSSLSIRPSPSLSCVALAHPLPSIYPPCLSCRCQSHAPIPPPHPSSACSARDADCRSYSGSGGGPSVGVDPPQGPMASPRVDPQGNRVVGAMAAVAVAATAPNLETPARPSGDRSTDPAISIH